MTHKKKEEEEEKENKNEKKKKEEFWVENTDLGEGEWCIEKRCGKERRSQVSNTQFNIWIKRINNMLIIKKWSHGSFKWLFKTSSSSFLPPSL